MIILSQGLWTAEDINSKAIPTVPMKNGLMMLRFLYIPRKQQLKIYPNVVLNVNNYQEQREENLIRLAKKVANDVKKTKNAVELDNMNSYERRIIHNALKDEKEISTISVGEEPNRHIVIKFIENQED